MLDRFLVLIDRRSFVHRRGRTSLVMFVVMLVICALFAVGAFLLYSSSRLPPSIPIPEPNAYDQMIRLSVSVQSIIENSVEDSNADELRALANANQEIIDEIDLVLQNASVVPIEYSQPFLQRELDRLSNLRRLHRLLHGAARLAELERRPFDAAEGYLRLAVAARKTQYGGFMIHALVGIAYERVAWEAIARLSEALSPEEKSLSLRKIHVLRVREPIADLLARETAYGVRAIGRLRAAMTKQQTQASFDATRRAIDEAEQLEARAIESLSRPSVESSLLDGDALRQISRLIHVAASMQGDMVRQKLKRNDGHNGL